ncbi:MAG: Na/Pi cotransporter family protein [Alphaproteobacteria bacterium]|nr:Na/Pi cotransporter family protein [Alphaproteobacteria bacterium]
MSALLIGTTVGGIGLFLLGMRMMTDGLKVAAGDKLRDILGKWTRTRARGLASGILITGIVQSSSAVTVAAIGFVNAGVISLGQAMWVVFGSNIGTTMTGWIVAIIGFDIKVEAFALPLLGLGMLTVLTGPSSLRGAIGEAVAGFGLLFLGIATLKAAFSGLGAQFDLSTLTGAGIFGHALMVGAGFLLTALMQSSSAVMAIALTAASGGLVSIEGGAALVIGANLGTTTTALLATIGATANAKRVAMSHVVFNGITGVAALLLLPLLLYAIGAIERSLAFEPGPATTLALFHTVFNILGVLLVWPVSARLETWLSKRFVSEEENESRPRYLDTNSLGIPALALQAILLELQRVALFALNMLRTSLTTPPPPLARLQRRAETVEHLGAAIMAYVQKLGMSRTPMLEAGALAHPIRAVWHFSELASHAGAIAGHRRQVERLPQIYRDEIDTCVRQLLIQCDAAADAFGDPSAQPPDDEAFEQVYQRVKSHVLVAASRSDISGGQAEAALEMLADLKAAARQLDRAGKRFAALGQAAAGRAEPEAVAETPARTGEKDTPAG